MAIKYFKYTLKTDDVHKAVSEVASHGIIVRTHTEGGRTHVYVASEEAPKHAAIKPTKVSESDVTKLN